VRSGKSALRITAASSPGTVDRQGNPTTDPRYVAIRSALRRVQGLRPCRCLRTAGGVTGAAPGTTTIHTRMRVYNGMLVDRPAEARHRGSIRARERAFLDCLRESRRRPAKVRIATSRSAKRRPYATRTAFRRWDDLVESSRRARSSA
jgi:hypothetical protein